ncbi:ADP-ribosylglycohydrolase family protein [cf. Phormidesmis sp. LEGE 11477]|uniref:ADP-ribosylglycohydrolase family protein n=1 Tax=cf. Phormidesmis sp. LEGE 11477 TaxID=1828680 RepID=UPI00187FFB54|nr:ADP-ribosylglycohydrolase family protein [cf. Phormidesmis sp. LEGE 11477]MBE9060839.1 ADP-ribosylglycohydrolase family protein [cf. Phormidesmis sp. LEGE 11477]
MLGAIAGDIIGSVYEFNQTKRKDFDLFTAQSSFTDDSILSIAVADVVLHNDSDGGNYAAAIKRYAQRYPHPMGGYGARFSQWAQSASLQPYNSWGNGSAMRVSPIGFACDTMHKVLDAAKQSAAVTHNHPEGIKGAQATAAAIFLARNQHDKQTIKAFIEQTFEYNLSRTLSDIRPTYAFCESCHGSVPESMIAFLESADFEDAIRNAISLGGDTDTMGAITGSIAEAFYGGVPDAIAQECLRRLDVPLRQMTLKFCDRYTKNYSSLLPLSPA